MSENLSTNALIHFICSAIVTCICCLMIMMAEGADKLIFVNYIVASTTQILVYTVGGHLLVEATTKIKFVAYDFHWYKCDTRIRNMILMMIIRSQKRSAVEVPFFEASMETFGSVSRWLNLCETNIHTHLLVAYKNSWILHNAFEDIFVKLEATIRRLKCILLENNFVLLACCQ